MKEWYEVRAYRAGEYAPTVVFFKTKRDAKRMVSYMRKICMFSIVFIECLKAAA